MLMNQTGMIFVTGVNIIRYRPSPATVETIVNYINDLADYAKISTIRRRISAISENYNAAGFSEQIPVESGLSGKQ